MPPAAPFNVLVRISVTDTAFASFLSLVLQARVLKLIVPWIALGKDTPALREYGFEVSPEEP